MRGTTGLPGAKFAGAGGEVIGGRKRGPEVFEVGTGIAAVPHCLAGAQALPCGWLHDCWVRAH